MTTDNTVGDETSIVPAGTPKLTVREHEILESVSQPEPVLTGVLSAKGRPPVTQIRLFWKMREAPGLSPKEYAEALAISNDAARQALVRLRSRNCQEQIGESKKRNGMTKLGLDKWCPECFRPAVILDSSTNLMTCTRCGVELKISPFVDGRLGSPFEVPVDISSQEYALPSIIDHNLGSDVNGLICELRYQSPMRIPGRSKPEDGWPAREAITEPYLTALGFTHWRRLSGKGGDDALTRKALAIFSAKIKHIPLPSPSWKWSGRMGLEVRRCVICLEGPEHISQMADQVLQEGLEWMTEEMRKRVRKAQSSACLGAMIDEVIKEAMNGTIERAKGET